MARWFAVGDLCTYEGLFFVATSGPCVCSCSCYGELHQHYWASPELLAKYPGCDGVVYLYSPMGERSVVVAGSGEPC